ncbi:MAG: outer membrane beta-barrel protein [Bacteroidales bacterium]
MKRIIFTLFVVLLLKSSFSQNHLMTSLKGKLVDEEDNTALLFANIGLLTAKDTNFVKGTTTDDKGAFEFRNLSGGEYFLRVSYMGYPTQLIEVRVQEGTVNDIGKLKLQKTTQILDAVEITAEKLMYQYEADKKIYNVTEDASVLTSSASEALQNAPGVWVDLEGNISLRGVDNVEIWINDKPSRIPADGLKTYLQQLPANSLERIEVMTNPSSKYSASGTAGIINIVTKQKIKENFLLTLSGRASTQYSYNPSFSFVWSNEKLKVNTYLSRSWQEYKSYSYNRGVVSDDTLSLYAYNRSSSNSTKYAWNSLYTDVGYEFSDKTSANIYVGGSFSNSDGMSASVNEKEDFIADILSSIVRSNNSENGGLNWHAGGSFKHEFKPRLHYIDFDFYVSEWGSSDLGENTESTTGDIFRDRSFKSDSKTNMRWASGDISYFNNFKEKYTFEAGSSLRLGNNNNSNPVDSFNYIDKMWYHAALFSNSNNGSSRDINNYISWQHKIKTFAYKVGLRSEYKYNFLHSVPMNEDVDASYWGLFPSAHLSYQTKKFYSYSLSYSRRVQYPQIWFLDPFVNYQNEESIWKGNADLQPAFTNSYEAGASKYFNKIGYLSMSLYHRRTEKSHTFTTEAVYDDYLQRYTLFQFMTNSGRDIFTGGDITFTFQPKPYMNVMLNANVYIKDIYAEMDSYTVKRNSFSYDGRVSFSSKVYKNYHVQLVGFYRSKSATLSGSSGHSLFTNASVRADFFERKLSASLSVQDIFNTQRHITVVNTPFLNSNSKSWSNSRYISLGITWRIGKIELEREQKSGADMTNPQQGMGM